jgi:3-oxoadipate enol-lactonase
MCPVLVIVGANDTPYSLAAADHMAKHIKLARKVVIDDAGHLPNMEHPQQFHTIVSQFLDNL